MSRLFQLLIIIQRHLASLCIQRMSVQTTKSLTMPTDLNSTLPTLQRCYGVTTEAWATAGIDLMGQQGMQWRTNACNPGGARHSARAGIVGHILRFLSTVVCLFQFLIV